MRPLIPDDDPQQIARIEDRLRRLEQASFQTVRQVSGVSSVSLGNFDGDNITGVRIAGTVVTAATGGDQWMRLKPNGGTIVGSVIVHRHYANGSPTYPVAHDVIGGGTPSVSLQGINIATTNWTTNANLVSFTGTLFTSRGNGAIRHYHGTFSNADYQIDSGNRLMGLVYGVWQDNTTPLTSLVFSLDAGTFSGRVSVEVIP